MKVKQIIIIKGKKMFTGFKMNEHMTKKLVDYAEENSLSKSVVIKIALAEFFKKIDGGN